MSSSEEETSLVKGMIKSLKERILPQDKKGKASKGKSTKDWKEDEVFMLIELLEERPSLWDVF